MSVASPILAAEITCMPPDGDLPCGTPSTLPLLSMSLLSGQNSSSSSSCGGSSSVSSLPLCDSTCSLPPPSASQASLSSDEEVLPDSQPPTATETTPMAESPVELQTEQFRKAMEISDAKELCKRRADIAQVMSPFAHVPINREPLLLTPNQLTLISKRYLAHGRDGIPIETTAELFARVAAKLAGVELRYALSAPLAELRYQQFYKVQYDMDFIAAGRTNANILNSIPNW